MSVELVEQLRERYMQTMTQRMEAKLKRVPNLMPRTELAPARGVRWHEVHPDIISVGGYDEVGIGDPLRAYISLVLTGGRILQIPRYDLMMARTEQEALEMVRSRVLSATLPVSEMTKKTAYMDEHLLCMHDGRTIPKRDCKQHWEELESKNSTQPTNVSEPLPNSPQPNSTKRVRSAVGVSTPKKSMAKSRSAKSRARRTSVSAGTSPPSK